jgi:hypothetical protein
LSLDWDRLVLRSDQGKHLAPILDGRRSVEVDDIGDGYAAGFNGAPCPGPDFTDAYRLGWEMGAIAAYRVPPPAWMDACNAQAASDCIASA